MKQVKLPAGETVAALGQGTWQIGDDPARRSEEVATLQRGIDLGMTLIDTAEMYGDGRSEELVAQALAGRRDQAFIVSKFYPHHASKKAARKACHDSLQRLATDRIDLYLLHWPGSVPLEETVAVMQELQREGKIRHWGVSNFDSRLTDTLLRVSGGNAVATNQVLYNLMRRGIEWDLLPQMRAQGIPLMAYSPVEQGELLRHPGLISFARNHSMTTAQAALAWLLRHDDVIVIPKSSRRERVEDNAAAAKVEFTAAQLQELDRLFAPPAKASPLAMI